MCTATYLPISKDRYILTTNRDESPLRAPVTFPYFHHVYGKEVIYPQDGESQGSWIGATDFGGTAVIMNGAHGTHERKPPYRMSRGLVLLEALECIRPEEFGKNFDFSGIEPFTLLYIFPNPNRKVLEFKWDGEERHFIYHDPDTPKIWGAPMLYDAEGIQLREDWFKEWLDSEPDFSIEEITKFHYEAGADNAWNGIRMNREDRVATISITSLDMGEKKCRMYHHDFRKDSKSEIVFQQLPVDMYQYVYDQA